jgi:hypothetical protein
MIMDIFIDNSGIYDRVYYCIEIMLNYWHRWAEESLAPFPLIQHTSYTAFLSM